MTDRVVPIGGQAKGGCPICGKPAQAAYRPFCSKRCADIDLHRWLSGSYRVPTEEAPAEGEALPPEDKED